MVLDLLGRIDWLKSLVYLSAINPEYTRRYSKKSGIPWPGGRIPVCVTFDLDYQKDVDALDFVLDVFSSFNIKSSFACIGKLIEKNPRVHDRLLDDGHEIINHTYSHPNNEVYSPNRFFNKIPKKERVEEIRKTQAVCTRLFGYTPTGFRTPHFAGLHGYFVYPILKSLGMRYSSSVLAVDGANPRFVSCILELPVTTCPKNVFHAFDTYHGIRKGVHARDFYYLFEFAVNVNARADNMVNVYFDPQDVFNTRLLERMLEMLSKKRVWVAKTEEVAVWCSKNKK